MTKKPLRPWSEVPYDRLHSLWFKANASASDATVSKEIRADFKDLSDALVELMVRRIQRHGARANAVKP